MVISSGAGVTSRYRYRACNVSVTLSPDAFLQGLGASGSGISAPVAAVGTASGAGNKGGLGKQVGEDACVTQVGQDLV